MTLTTLIQQKGLTVYALSKASGIPYTTVSDICSGKTRLEKCSAETLYKLSKELGTTMEALIEPYVAQRTAFELFKSNVCHRLRELGDTNFIIDTLTKDDIYKYYRRMWYPEALYLLAMLDYISHINAIPLCSEYDALRKCKLQKPLFPGSVLASAAMLNNDHVKEQAMQQAIPEFMRFNIVESEVRNVI
ncbi:MAG: helix-turn-helix transcriptional regulator [Eubacteriales bacterium]|nr:helix-turn-helix transcriptional regulator [Eubacteriales bacterium]